MSDNNNPIHSLESWIQFKSIEVNFQCRSTVNRSMEEKKYIFTRWYAQEQSITEAFNVKIAKHN